MNKKILYVEDNRDIAEVVKLILEELDCCSVDLAYDGEECISRLKKTKYNLVIFDIMLPDISGLKLFDLARLDENQRGTKYAFLTITHLTLKQKSDLKDKGVRDFISKPFEKEDLVTRIKAILED